MTPLIALIAAYVVIILSIYVMFGMLSLREALGTLVMCTLCGVFSYRDIIKDKPDGPSLYLRRFYLTMRARPRWWPQRWKWYRLFLHNILRSDDDRGFHDHPWNFTSIILAGKYVESIFYPNNRMMRHRKRITRWLSVLRNSATHTHRVEIVRPVWSLVIASEATREWGFWIDGQQVPGVVVPDRWVMWREYLNEPNGPLPLEDRIRGVQ